jgi:hypothetical protein
MKIALVLNGVLVGWYVKTLLEYISQEDKRGICIAIAGILVPLLCILTWFL